MEATVKAHEQDSINIQSGLDKTEIIFSIWGTGAHKTTYLTAKEVKELIYQLQIALMCLEQENV